MSAPPVVADLTYDLNDRNHVILSIFDLLEAVSSALSGSSDSTLHVNEVVELKKHSAELLRYIYGQNDGDNTYLSTPKSPQDLAYLRIEMLEGVELDVAFMKRYLSKLGSGYHLSTPDGETHTGLRWWSQNQQC